MITEEMSVQSAHPVLASKRLHLGAGDVYLEGWHNTDLSPEKPHIHKLDVRERFPFEDSSLELIFTEHMIEHLTQAEGRFMLCECYRVLGNGGVVRIATPDLRVLIDLFVTNVTDHQAYLEWIAGLNYPDNTRPCVVINNAFYNWGHKFLYDFETLESSIFNAGFKSVKRFLVGESDIKDLRLIEGHGRVVGNERMNELETMVVEAYK